MKNKHNNKTKTKTKDREYPDHSTVKPATGLGLASAGEEFRAGNFGCCSGKGQVRKNNNNNSSVIRGRVKEKGNEKGKKENDHKKKGKNQKK
jgi:hypothetical protein